MENIIVPSLSADPSGTRKYNTARHEIMKSVVLKEKTTQGRVLREMAETAQPQETILEIQPHEFMTRLGPRLRVNGNRESGRYTASFAGVFEKLGNNTKQVVLGVGRTEMDACRALALKMKELYLLNRLQVLADNVTSAGPEKIVTNNVSCNTWFKRT